MDETEQLRILTVAQGDAAALGLALIDLSFAREDHATRAQLRAALEAAAVPHWVTPAVLAALLGAAEPEATALLARLRPLTIVEPFPARGEAACNVHEETRLALTHRLAETGRLPELAERCADMFQGAAAHERIERAFHLAIARPSEGADAIEALFDEWSHAGRVEELQALGAACAELRNLPRLDSLTRAVALETLGRCRSDEVPLAETRVLATEALAVYRAVNDRRRCASAFRLLGEVAEPMGDTAAARDAYAEALRLRRALAPATEQGLTHQTADSVYRLFVAVRDCYELDLAHEREVAAKQLHAEGHELAKRLVAFDSTSTRFQHALYLSLFSRAKLETADGRTEAAARTHVESLELARRLVAMDATNSRFQRRVYVSLFWVADIELEHNTEAARRLHREGLEIARTLAALNPASTTAQRDVAFSFSQLASIELSQHRAGEARDLLLKQLEIERRLSALDPANTELTWTVSATLDRLGRIADLRGRLDEAQAAFGESLEIARQCRLDPTDITYRRNLSCSLVNCADIFHAREQFEEARAMYDQAVEIDHQLIAPDPTHVTWKGDVWNLALALNRLGKVAIAENHPAEARRVLSQAMEPLRRLVSEHQDYVDAQTELVNSLYWLGVVSVLEDRLDDAARLHDEALGIARAVFALHPENSDARNEMGSAMVALGSIALSRGQVDEALSHVNEALAIARELVALDATRVDWQEARYRAQITLSKIYAQLARPTEASQALEEARSVIEALLTIDPDRRKWQADLRELDARS